MSLSRILKLFNFISVHFLFLFFLPTQWNISDHFYQNRVRITDELNAVEKELPWRQPDTPAFDALWMCVYARLGDLCVDSRPAVRKSAGQTLFSMLGAHGNLLQKQTWHNVLWAVSDCLD